MEFAKKNMT